MILTANEKCVLRFLAVSITKEMSMNDVGRACGVSSGGAFKILTKLEKEGVLKAKSISNIKIYSLDFQNEKTARVLELALIPDSFEERVKLRMEDLKLLKTLTEACILFGSYVTTKKKPGDLDVLFVLDRKNFGAYKQTLVKVQDITPVKIHDVVQTTLDLEQNLKKNDMIIIPALKNGIVLWGFDILVQVIKNACR
ncbi:hypothetical protein J4457_04150 [Candidatus Woesearchaeota archaeon]|nr:hypothetical protein [Candidatus Woesearchaeota archaeon]